MALAAFSPRTRDFFAAFGKFEGFERAAPVPAAAGHVPCAFPRAPAGRRGTGRGAGRTLRQAQQHKKSTGSFDSVLSCTSMGMRALASLPDVPCVNIIAHRRGVVNTAPASKAICQALAALQIALMWYNLEPPSTESPGRARDKRAGEARPLRAPGLEEPPTPATDTHRTPDAKRGNRRAHGRPQGRPGAFVVRLCACPPWLAGRPLPREGARRSPRASARLPRTGACAQPLPRAALSALSPTVRGKTREAATGGAGTPGAHAGMFR